MNSIFCISKNKINDFIAYLSSRYDVFAPQEKGTDIIFDKVDGSKSAAFGYKTTILPPKKYFFPEKEELFRVRNTKKGKSIKGASLPKPFVIFGLNLKDLKAISYLDEIMSFKSNDDFYLKRRDKSILIAMSDEPICNPFLGVCVPFGGYATPSFGDLILEKIGKGGSRAFASLPPGDLYAATAFSDKGKKLLKLKYFSRKKAPSGLKRPLEKFVSKENNNYNWQAREQTKKDFSSDSRVTQLHEQSEYIGLDNLIKDSELLAKAVEWSWKNYQEIWDELDKQCLGCGNCTYVCPLCYCFDIEDKIINKDECARCRKWDACTLPDFNLLAGGHTFHPQIKHRYYNWYYHKFVRAYNEFGRPLCVACHRCQRFCPAGIDIEQILNRIIEKYNKIMS